MNAKEQFTKLLQAQDLVRRVWANEDNQSVSKSLKELDKEITKSIEQFYKINICTAGQVDSKQQRILK